MVPNLGDRDELTLAMEVGARRGRCGVIADAIELGIEGTTRMDELMVAMELSVEIWELDLRCVAAAARGSRRRGKEEMGKVTACFTLTLYL